MANSLFHGRESTQIVCASGNRYWQSEDFSQEVINTKKRAKGLTSESERLNISRVNRENRFSKWVQLGR
jgi:hypothetical protein